MSTEKDFELAWDDNDPKESFFGIPPSEQQKGDITPDDFGDNPAPAYFGNEEEEEFEFGGEVIKSPGKPKIAADEPKDKGKKKEEKANQEDEPKDDDPLEDGGEGDDEGEDLDKPKGEEKEEPSETNIYGDLIEDFADSNLLILPEGFDGSKVSKEEFYSLWEKSAEARLDADIDELKKALDEDGVKFLNFKVAGGNTSEFFELYAQKKSTSWDPENDKHQADIIKFYLTEYEKYEEKDALEEIEDLEITPEKMKARAARYHKIIKAKEDAAAEAKLKSVEDAKAAEKAQAVARESKLKETFSKLEKVNGKPISKEERADLFKFMLVRDAKTDKGFTAALYAEFDKVRDEDPETFIAIAQLLKNRGKKEDKPKAKAGRLDANIIRKGVGAGAGSGKKTSKDDEKPKPLSAYF